MTLPVVKTSWPCVTPATTCALVSTCPGAYTKPDPSILCEQLGAMPSTFTMLPRAAASPAELRTAGLGGATASTPSGPSAPKAGAYGAPASGLRDSENL